MNRSGTMVVTEQTSETLSIGQVVRALKAVSPDVTSSMLRHWEQEGLISPRRTPGGHRQYSRRDLDRLRTIVELRSRRYLPLDMVKFLLRRMEEDPTYDVSFHDQIFRPVQYDPDFVPLSREEAAKYVGLSPATLENLEALGLVVPAGDEPAYDEDDLRILRLLVDLQALGIKAESVWFYAEHASRQAQQELEVFRSVIRNQSTTQAKHAMYRRLQRITCDLQALLYQKYVRRELSALLTGRGG